MIRPFRDSAVALYAFSLSWAGIASYASMIGSEANGQLPWWQAALILSPAVVAGISTGKRRF